MDKNKLDYRFANNIGKLGKGSAYTFLAIQNIIKNIRLHRRRTKIKCLNQELILLTNSDWNILKNWYCPSKFDLKSTTKFQISDNNCTSLKFSTEPCFAFFYFIDNNISTSILLCSQYSNLQN